MEEVLEKLGTTLISPESNFEALYKNWGKLGNQEERRKELLEIQKSNRNDRLDKFRGIMDLLNTVEETKFFKKSDSSHYRPSIYVAGFNKASTSYKNILMMSEWMVEKPEDFDENWLVVPCPKGVRMLVVANNGITKFFTKYGQFKFKKHTVLPGGNRYSSRNNKCCVLDIFFQEKNNTAYILDLLAWNNQPMTDGETEFRHYWLQSQLAELPNLNVINKKNEINITILPKISCSPESIKKFMMRYPPFHCNFPPQDGLLFYHKKTHYISGETPLVGWLFPYMVPEVLGSEIAIHRLFLLEKPSDYVNQADFIEKFEAKYAKRRNGKKRTSTSSMDTTDSTESNKSKETNEQEDGDVMEAEEATCNVKEESRNHDNVKLRE